MRFHWTWSIVPQRHRHKHSPPAGSSAGGAPPRRPVRRSARIVVHMPCSCGQGKASHVVIRPAKSASGLCNIGRSVSGRIGVAMRRRSGMQGDPAPLEFERRYRSARRVPRSSDADSRLQRAFDRFHISGSAERLRRSCRPSAPRVRPPRRRYRRIVLPIDRHTLIVSVDAGPWGRDAPPRLVALLQCFASAVRCIADLLDSWR